MTNNPGKRPIQEEPEFSTGELIAPRWLKRDGLDEWKRVVPELEALGLARIVSAGALEGLCALYGSAVKASRSGDAREMRQSWAEYRKMCETFGLTPSSAARVGGAKKPANKTNPFKALG